MEAFKFLNYTVADALATKGDLAAALNKSADEATKELKDKGFLK